MIGARRINDDAAGSADAVLAVAERLFYASGITAVVMQDIRAAAGVSLKRLYSHFASKDDLVLAYLTDRSERWLVDVTAAVEATGTSPHARIDALFSWLDTWFHDPSFNGCPFVNARGELGALPDSARAVIDEHGRRVHRWIREVVLLEHARETVSGPDTDAGDLRSDLADEIFILLEGAINAATMIGDRDAARRAAGMAAVLERCRSAPHPAA